MCGSVALPVLYDERVHGMLRHRFWKYSCGITVNDRCQKRSPGSDPLEALQEALPHRF